MIRQIRPGGSFLEIGPGEYQLSRELAKLFDDGCLVEFHPEAQARYTSCLSADERERVRLVVGDFMAADFHQQFDCVIACEVLEHIEDDSAFLRKMMAALKPGGQMLLSVPAHERYWSTHDDLVGHLRRYSREQLADALNEVGMQQTKIFGYGYPFIHAFRLARETFALLQKPGKSRWNTEQRTKRSGIDHAPRRFHWLGVLANPITFWPLDFIAQKFEHTDRSDGFIALAYKPISW
ncbi:class I SAM-dependent methyltransferase [Alkalilimnicola sp. S0819]|nr:class I SAM-dependent methyltransferase [Alkalilimnicola sp. S0819]